jgi:glycine cleavage system H protein
MELEYPDGLQYLDSHEYIRLDNGIATIGITAYAINQLGDIVFLDLPQVGDAVEKGDGFGTVESVKAVEELFAPISGTVVEINEAVVETPESLADDPYGDGWLIKVRCDDDAALEDTMTAEEYQASVNGTD